MYQNAHNKGQSCYQNNHSFKRSSSASRYFLLLTKNSLLIFCYYMAAELGLRLGAVDKIATAIWIPTGLSLAALTIFGLELLPAVFIATFLICFGKNISAAASVGVAAGNTIEAYLGCTLLQRVNFDKSMSRIQELLKFVLFGVFFNTLVGSIISVGALLASSTFRNNHFTNILFFWETWWLGDAMGALLIAPLIFSWYQLRKSDFHKEKYSLANLLELIFVVFVMIVLSYFVFGRMNSMTSFPGVYYVFPPLLWAAARYFHRGVTTMTLLTYIIATYYAVRGLGIFEGLSLGEALLQLQLFMAVAIITGLVTATIAQERENEARSLEATARDLKDALRIRDEFLSIASHELKTPVTALKLQLETAKRRFPGPDLLQRSLDNSGRQIDRLTKLIDDLLDVARIQSGKLAFNFEVVDLSKLIHEVIADRLGEQISTAGATIEFDLEDVSGFWDRSRIEQILLNLISNAIKYAPHAPIKITTQKLGPTARLIIQDFGPGITQEEQEKIFEKFERTVAARRISGLGLGLFIVKKIVEGHQGCVRVESTPGLGSSFVVDLPIFANRPMNPVPSIQSDNVVRI
ncbi:MAG: MASE1 domain-containing protein [Bacteriovoracia bacterium]